MTNNDVLTQYVELKLAIKANEEKLQELKDKFYEVCDKKVQKGEVLEIQGAKISRSERPIWEYSKKIGQLEAELKEAKKKYESKNEPVRVQTTFQVKF